MSKKTDRDRVPHLIELARRSFVALAEAYHLKLEWDVNEQVELGAWLRRQPGLDWDLWLNLQNGDEIGIQHDFFYVEWFPADDPVAQSAFTATVEGLFSGAVRLKCSFGQDSSRPYRVEFQREAGDGWSTFYLYAKGLRARRPALVSILRNGHPTIAVQ